MAALAFLLGSTAMAPQANAASGMSHPIQDQDCGLDCGGGQVRPDSERMTIEIGAVSLALSTVALPRLTDPVLKAFAASEVESQQGNAKRFEAEKGTMAPSGFMALDRVRYASQGPELDEVYRTEELSILRRLLASHERDRDSRKAKPRARGGASNEMLTAYAVRSIAQVREKIAAIEATRNSAGAP